jgi:hypothetical protein
MSVLHCHLNKFKCIDTDVASCTTRNLAKGMTVSGKIINVMDLEHNTGMKAIGIKDTG